MKKRLIKLIAISSVTTMLIGCGGPIGTVGSVSYKVSKDTTLDNFIKIDKCLWYDSNTGVVYLWNGYLGSFGNYATTPTAYYSPNGYLYRYDPQTNTLEEIIPKQ